MFGESLNNLSSSPGRKPAVNSSGRFVLRVCLTNVHVGVQLFALSGTQLSVNYVSASRWESWSLVPFLSCLRQSGCSSYKVRMTGAPSYLSQHLVQHVATRQTRSTALPLLTIPRTNTEFARRSYSYSAPFIWNSLPGDVLNCNSEHTFKKHLKTFLFTSCFYAAWLTPPLASASVASRMTLYKFDYCYYYYVITSFLTRNIVMTLNNVKAKVIAETTWYYWAISWFSNSHPSFAFRTICSWTRRNVVPESYE